MVLLNRFDVIDQNVKNGAYVELDELSKVMGHLCDSVVECKNVTEDTLKFIDQLLNKKVSSLNEILNKALHAKNKPVIEYLSNLYKNYHVVSNVEYKSYCYLDDVIITKEVTDTTLLEYILKCIIDYEACEFIDDFEFNKYLLNNNIFTLGAYSLILSNIDDFNNEWNVKLLLYLYELIDKNNLRVQRMDNQVINYILKYGEAEDLDTLLTIVSKDVILNNMKIDVFFNISNRSIIMTRRLFDTFVDYKNKNLEYFKGGIDKYIINYCTNKYDSRVLELLFEHVTYDKEYFIKLILLAFCYTGSIDTNLLELIKYLFDISTIEPTNLINQILHSDPIINETVQSTEFKDMIKQKFCYEFYFTKGAKINCHTVLDFYKYLGINIDHKVINEYINRYSWEDLFEFLNDRNEKINDDLKDCIKHKEIDRETLESFYKRVWLKFDLVTKHNIFRIASNDTELFLGLIRYYIEQLQYAHFKKFMKIYPEFATPHLNLIYNTFLELYDDKMKSCLSYEISSNIRKFLKYFDAHNIDIGLRYYHILSDDFCGVFNKYYPKYGFDIHDKRVNDVFDSLCIQGSNDLLVFIEHNPDFDHLITGRAICFSGHEDNGNRIRYFYNRIISKNIILDVNELYQWCYDIEGESADVLDDICAVLCEKNKE
jgi:hypothetical protein